MAVVRRIAITLTALLGAIVYVWIAGVRAAPAIRRRKAAARRRD